MLTARTDATDVIVSLELGADDYVTKPFDMPVLVARCRAVLGARRRSPPTRPSASVTSRSTSPGSSPARTAATSR